ncbi:MAG TPA: helix-turn-helix domain-containing protein [Pyrinomonadaceae bacterium]|nr:helix-turn-helix domain-containing protein [Pyrinomonadaceae bacterium]
MESTTATADVDRTSEPKYSRDEAAKLIGISPVTVWREIQRGRLQCYRVCGGRVLLIGKSHIEKYLADSEQRGLLGVSE